MRYTIEQVKQHIAANIVINDNGCHIWTGSLTKDGYPQLTIDAISDGYGAKGVHRLALILETGITPSRSLQACHRGGCPRNCCNPMHLKWGTAKQNAADRVTEGVNFKGENHPRAKLKDADVIAIHERLATGERQKTIAADFGIRVCHVSSIKRRVTWKHLA